MTIPTVSPPAELLAPEQCCLIVIDKQRWYYDPAVSPFARDRDPSHARADVQGIDELVSVARQGGVPVLWTRMSEGAVDAPENVAVRWRQRPGEPRLQPGDPGYEIWGVQPGRRELVVDKDYPDAFSVSLLPTWLDQHGVQTVVLVGGYTSRCVLATAFGAQSHGLHVLIPEGLADPHPGLPSEERIALEVVRSAVGWVVTPQVLAETWTGDAPVEHDRC